MVSADARDPLLAQQAQGLLGKQPVVEQIAAAQDALDADPVDLHERVAQGVNVRVDVGDHREFRHVQTAIISR